MYAFAPFTDVFLAYVAIMGMSSYGLLDGQLRLDIAAIADELVDAPRRATGWFLLVVSGLFAVMWMVMLLRDHPAGPALASVLLVLKLTLGVALLSMSFTFAETPAWGEAGLWTAIVLVSIGWITAGLRRKQPVASPWIRRSLWPANGDTVQHP